MNSRNTRKPRPTSTAALLLSFFFGGLLFAGFTSQKPPTTPTSPTNNDAQSELVAKGREIFFNETFDGNGRTCSTCHRPEDNYRITPEFIASLPEDDPLFVHEFNPDLKENFEKADLLRKYGLILGNPAGFDDLENEYVMRTVSSLRSVRTSINGSEFEGFENKISFLGPLTGWAGDGFAGWNAPRVRRRRPDQGPHDQDAESGAGRRLQIRDGRGARCPGGLHPYIGKTGGAQPSPPPEGLSSALGTRALHRQGSEKRPLQHLSH